MYYKSSWFYLFIFFEYSDQFLFIFIKKGLTIKIYRFFQYIYICKCIVWQYIFLQINDFSISKMRFCIQTHTFIYIMRRSSYSLWQKKNNAWYSIFLKVFIVNTRWESSSLRTLLTIDAEEYRPGNLILHVLSIFERSTCLKTTYIVLRNLLNDAAVNLHMLQLQFNICSS